MASSTHSSSHRPRQELCIARPSRVARYEVAPAAALNALQHPLGLLARAIHAAELVPIFDNATTDLIIGCPLKVTTRRRDGCGLQAGRRRTRVYANVGKRTGNYPLRVGEEGGIRHVQHARTRAAPAANRSAASQAVGPPAWCNSAGVRASIIVGARLGIKRWTISPKMRCSLMRAASMGPKRVKETLTLTGSAARTSALLTTPRSTWRCE